MNAENGDTDQECGVHAMATVALPHRKCSYVVHVWDPPEGLVHSGKYLFLTFIK